MAPKEIRNNKNTCIRIYLTHITVVKKLFKSSKVGASAIFLTKSTLLWASDTADIHWGDA